MHASQDVDPKLKRVNPGLVLILFFALNLVQFTGARAQEPDDNEKIKVDTNLVNLSVNVFRQKAGGQVNDLKASDFAVYDQGKQQTISFFETTTAPFDLILLIDLSGSTREKLKLIKKSSTGFVNAVRPVDRIGIVTFSSGIDVVSDVTGDRNQLLEKIKQISKPEGGTNFWDSLGYVLTDMIGKKSRGRRTAIIAMTDGVDNALPGVQGDGSKLSFLNLVELVRQSEAVIMPIYLDTEEDEVKNFGIPRHAYELARKSLDILAEQSGGVVFRAKKVEDLKGVYENVIENLGNIYSVGYTPSVDVNARGWHNVRIAVLNKPELSAHTRPGYIAK